jgi:drug/metabolite transporter (DMT)-like permease
MILEILLALVASLFTATSSVAQRVAAAPAPGEITFSWRLLTFLLRRPVWFLGIVCMIAGFIFQLAALHFGQLTLVQPVIATELLFVFAYLALRNRNRVHLRDWAAAAGMAVGLGGFLFLADPSGGQAGNATMATWLLAAASTFGAVALIVATAVIRYRPGAHANPARKAALLSIAAGTAWGFMAAVIKELSVHVNQGAAAVFTNWSPYALVGGGALAMYLVTIAFQAGPLAASQPGLTICDPLVASLLGVTIFGDHIRHGPWALAGEAAAAAVLAASVVLLSRSQLIQPPAAVEAPGEGGPAEDGGSPSSGPKQQPDVLTRIRLRYLRDRRNEESPLGCRQLLVRPGPLLRHRDVPSPG